MCYFCVLKNGFHMHQQPQMCLLYFIMPGRHTFVLWTVTESNYILGLLGINIITEPLPESLQQGGLKL